MDRRHVGAARIIRGNALALPLADDSVDLVVTSPPYFGLRSYQDGGEHYAGQIGAEATPAEFVDALIAAAREMVRVLKPSGSIWVNLGDKYQATSFAPNQRGKDTPGVKRPSANGCCERCGKGFTGGPGRRFCSAACGGSDNSRKVNRGGIREKSLIGIPWRYALRCIDDLGLILRAEVIWSKPNGLPESVTDRVRRSHEQWFHFTLNPRYYSAVDEIREEHQHPEMAKRGRIVKPVASEHLNECYHGRAGNNPLGKLPGSVWSIPTQPLKVPASLGIDHFAAFPMEWPRRIIQGWSPAGVCVECGEGRRPVSEGERVATRPSGIARIGTDMDAVSGVTRVRSDVGNVRTERTITGYACACPEPTADTTPGVVLDPFGGTGTTALVAKALGRDGISVDMSADYCRLAQWRTTDPGELANAMRVDKPVKQIDGQVSMFDLLNEEGGAA